MFTVIIAEKSFIETCNTYNPFTDSMLDRDRIALCEWNPSGKNLDEMVPRLYKLVEYRDEWRAIIINGNPDTLYKRNPFDFVDFKNASLSRSFDPEDIQAEFSKKIALYKKAAENPIVKLSTAFYCNSDKGLLSNSDPESAENNTVDAIINGSLSLYEYMLEKLLKSMNLTDVAAKIKRYRIKQLNKYVKSDLLDDAISLIRNGDAAGLMEVLKNGSENPDKGLFIEFLEFISDFDPAYSDPKYAEYSIEGTIRSRFIRDLSTEFIFNDKLPKEVICVSPRIYEPDANDQEILAYSAFTNYNLYNEGLKYILFDILPEENRQYKFSMLRFLFFLLLVSQNTPPPGSIRIDKVHVGNIEFDNERFKALCNRYVSKLIATQAHVKELHREYEENRKGIDDKTSRELFESNVAIPVQIVRVFNRSEMLADFQELGLATDCPQDEESFWSSQYKKISKTFIRYLREPRRALERSVEGDFRLMDEVKDERIKDLNKSQREDVLIHLHEEERSMISMETSNIYDEQKFADRMDEANKKIIRRISGRMTKGKTILCGLIPTLVFLISFMPMIFSNVNTFKSLLFSLIFAGLSAGLLALVGFVYLFIMKRRLIKVFKEFNFEMAGIMSEVDSSLDKYSKYLSHACNVMRDSSVLLQCADEDNNSVDVFRYHIIMIERCLNEVRSLLSQFIDQDSKIVIEDVQPYTFNFNLMQHYEYPMPILEYESPIEFIQPGNEIRLPVDFIKSVSLKKEELYD